VSVSAIRATLLAAVAIAAAVSLAPTARAQASDQAVVAEIIQASAAAYPGNCRCPDDVNRAGRRCGGTSAYSRAAGWKPLCYAQDVTSDLIDAWRRGDRDFIRGRR
jgi:hypothetical protein